MGTWSGDPFGNDSAVDWTDELENATDWSGVRVALEEVVDTDDYIDTEVASIAIAAVAVVTYGLGFTAVTGVPDAAAGFVARVGPPPTALRPLAFSALAAATSPVTELAELWMEGGSADWDTANAQLEAFLGGPY